MSKPDIDISSLGADLLKIPDVGFKQAVRQLEALRTGQHAVLVHALMDRLRPRLAELRPQRPPGFARVMCAAFDDLLVNDPGGKGQVAVGKVPRSVIRPTLRLLEQGLGKDKMKALEKAVQAAPEGPERLEATVKLWRETGELLRTDWKTGQSSKQRKEALIEVYGSQSLYLFLEDVGVFLVLACALVPLRTYLTKHGQQEELTDKNIEKITQLVVAIQEEDANSLNRVLDVMVARIGSPKQIARVMAALTECDEVGLSTHHQSRLAEALVGDSEQQIEDLTAAPEDMNPREAIKAINRVAERMFETVAEVDLGRAPGSARRARKGLGKIGASIGSRVLQGTDRDLSGTVSEAATQDLLQETNYAEQRTAEDRVLSLRLALRHAEDLGIADEIKQQLGDIEQSSRAAVSEIMAKVKEGNVGPVTREAVDERLFSVARMIELSAGPAAAYEMMKKARAELDLMSLS